jgi:large conductance mechanosensitive channel
MYEFISFIREQGVVGLAIGFILGSSVGKVVSSFVQDIVQPLIGLLVGSTEGLKAWQLGPVMLGNFCAVLIDFVIVAAIVFFVFKQLRIDRLDKKKD